jgi:hypothetical protein
MAKTYDPKTQAIAVILLRRGTCTDSGLEISVDLPITHQRHSTHADEVNCVIETFLNLPSGNLSDSNPFISEVESSGDTTIRYTQPTVRHSDQKTSYLFLNLDGLEKIAGKKVKAVKSMSAAVIAGYERLLPQERLRA